MKKTFIGIASILSLLLSGCGTVVYQIRPEAPPTMGFQEALEAMELSLSMMNPKRGYYSMKAEEDDILIFNIGVSFRIYYSAIEKDVRKMDNSYIVYVNRMGVTHSAMREAFSWKSLEEARRFVDAAHVLSMGQQRRAKTPVSPRPAVHTPQAVQTQEASLPIKPAPPAPPLPAPPSLPSAHPPVAKGLVESSKPPLVPVVAQDHVQVSRPAATQPAGAPSDQPPKTPVKATSKPKTQPKEEPPPKITITSPDTTRAIRIASRQSGLLVTGLAESGTGVSEVTVNGLPAELDEKGNFSREVFLKIGENKIQVAAQDIKGQSSTKEFSIRRESGKVMQARNEIPVPTSFIGASTFHALLIAVQDYDSKDVTRLDNPIADARRLKEVLTTHYTFDPSNVIILENPDRRTIYKTLQVMRKQLTERDSLLIFYAGHGMWVDDMKQGFWLPRDASGVNDPSDWIPNSTIRDYIKAFHARHVLLVADSCFSGGIFRVREAFPPEPLAIEKIFEMNSRKAITSGSLKSVPDRSVFVEFLVKRLKDNHDPYLDSQKLFTSLREAVINNSPTSQTPLYGAISEAGDEGGDFVFVRRQAE
jgi:hypothetical protein